MQINKSENFKKKHDHVRNKNAFKYIKAEL